jgi:hypothetical protein
MSCQKLFSTVVTFENSQTSEMKEEDTYLTTKYNELPFNRRHYTLFESIDSPIASVQELKQVVLNEWQVLERKPIVYDKAETVEFFKPTVNDINMTMNNNGQWTIVSPSSTNNNNNNNFNELEVEIEPPSVSISDVSTAFDIGGNNAGSGRTVVLSQNSDTYVDEDDTAIDDEEEEDVKTPLSPDAPSAEELRRSLSSNTLLRNRAQSNGGPMHAQHQRASTVSVQESVTRKSFLGGIFKTDRRKVDPNGVMRRTSNADRLHLDTTGAKIARESISEHLEKKPVNDIEISSIEPLANSMLLEKQLDMKDPSRLLSVQEPHFEFNGGKEKISCRRRRITTDPYPTKRYVLI